VCAALEEYLRADISLPPLVSETYMKWKVQSMPLIADICAQEKYGLARGGSSEQQLALFRLLVSLLKCSGEGGLDPSDRVPTVVAQAACSRLEDAAVAACAAGVDDRSAADADGSGVLWLLLLGRCCLKWAAALHRVERQGVSLVQVMEQQQKAQQKAVDGSGSGRVVTAGETASAAVGEGAAPWLFEGRELGPGLFMHADVVYSVACSLGEGVPGQCLLRRLLESGYDTVSIAEGMLAVSDSYAEVREIRTGADGVVADRVGGLIRQLVSLGEKLSVLAVPHCCNNPRCVNTSGRSERAIVSGKGCLCAGCKVAHSCGKTCQAAHWKKTAHRSVCKKLRQRRAFEACVGFCAVAAVLRSKSCLDGKG
jgi:hypothetical protein